jgi:hypothetical protein
MSSATQPKLLDCVALVCDRPDLGLVAGQAGTIVEEYDGSAYEVEFIDLDGRTIALETFRADELRLLGPNPN